MEFLFCNFMNSLLERRNSKGVKFIEESVKLSEGIQSAEVYLTKNSIGDDVLRFVCKGEGSTGTKFDLISHVDEELVHTDENPLIMVATRRFKVFKGIPTHIKYIPVKGGVLVLLLKGYISVEDKNGEMIPLSRNCDALSYDEGHVFNADEIYEMNLLEDKESDVKYSDYVVNDCIISLTVSKDNRNLRSIKFNKDRFVFLHTEVFEKGKARKEAKKAEIEAKRLRRAEEVASFYASRNSGGLSVGEEKKEKKPSSPKPKKTKDEDVQVGSSGAQSFLDFVNSLKK